MKRLIVNADDFGETPGVNRGVLEAHRRGLVTSASILVNGQAAKAALELSRQVPKLGLGVHLNLSEGIPLSPPRQIPTLVNNRGLLYLSHGQMRRALWKKQVAARDIETELRAQVTTVFESGAKPSHLDGHMHIHVLSGISEIVVRLAREFGVPAVRCPLEAPGRILRPPSQPVRSCSSLTRQRLVAFGVSLLARRLKWMLQRAGLAYAEHFYGLVQPTFVDATCIETILKSVPEGTSELMCHPRYAEPELLARGGELMQMREVEVQALTSPSAARLAETCNVRLSSYGDLAGSHSRNSGLQPTATTQPTGTR